jgi:hypothetical protein
VGIDVDIVGIKALRNRLKGMETGSANVTRALRRTLTKVWKDGAQEFIRVALKKVAVDTGMSAATFYALAKALRRNDAVTLVDVALTDVPTGQRKGVPEFPSGRRRPGIQDIGEGKDLGKRAFTFVVPAASSSQFVFKFNFQTVSWQMAFNDPEVEALTEGLEAFERIVEREFVEKARFIIDGYLRGKTVFFEGDD